MTNTNPVLGKIRKLLALARNAGATQAEAELAAEMAAKIMTEHQINVTDLALKEAQTTEAIVKRDRVGDFNSTCRWALTLAQVVAEMFDCETVNTSATDSYKAGFKATFVAWCGLPNDVEAAREVFHYLMDTWEAVVAHDLQNHRAMFRHWTAGMSRSYRHDHGHGFTHAIYNRVQGQVRARKEAVQVTTTGTALIVLKGELVKAAQKKEFPRLRKSAPTRYRASDAYLDGRRAGENASLGSKRIGGK